MGVVHAGIHSLTRFRRMGVASIAGNENSLIYGESRGYALPN
jgi:hypothetical protein